LATSTRIFTACFVNTCLILILCQGKIPTISSPASFSVGSSTYGLLIGEHQDLDWKWYPAVGTAVMTAMFANIFVPHLPFAYYHYISHPLRRWFKLKFMRSTIVTQTQMNHAFACPHFQLQTRLPIALNTIYSALMYSGTMPILIPFAAVSLMLQAFVDKYGLLRVYQAPTTLGPELMKSATKLLMPAILIHLAISIWAFSNVEVRDHNADFSYRPLPPTPAPQYNATLAKITARLNLTVQGAILEVSRLCSYCSLIEASRVCSYCSYTHVNRREHSCSPSASDLHNKHQTNHKLKRL
jgi:hypothetical protein